MDREAALEIINAIKLAQKKYPINEPNGKKPPPWRSPHRQWDKIICRICAGCGKRLGRYENTKNLAFFYECREILFPESIPARESFKRKFSKLRCDRAVGGQRGGPGSMTYVRSLQFTSIVSATIYGITAFERVLFSLMCWRYT